MFFFGSQIFNDTTYWVSLIQKPNFSCSRQISDRSLVVQNTHRTPGAVWQLCCNDHMFWEAFKWCDFMVETYFEAATTNRSRLFLQVLVFRNFASNLLPSLRTAHINQWILPWKPQPWFKRGFFPKRNHIRPVYVGILKHEGYQIFDFSFLITHLSFKWSVIHTHFCYNLQLMFSLLSWSCSFKTHHFTSVSCSFHVFTMLCYKQNEVSYDALGLLVDF